MVYILKIKNSEWYAAIGGIKDFSVKNVMTLISRISEIVSPNLFQLFDADNIAGWKHLFFSAVNSVKAFESGYAISRNLDMELMLCASCQDQISKAIKQVGISPSTKRVALLILTKNHCDLEPTFRKTSKILGQSDDSILNMNEEKLKRLKKIFNVSELELEALQRDKREALTQILIEKGSLIATRR
jgi:tRNA threonylcarbamoyladenosine modification (KEOPS) complex Cgi121 subunit